jgi:hypothetical protein
MRPVRTALLMAVAAVLLSGCFRYQSTVVVDSDGSGTAQELLLVDRAVAEEVLGSDTDVETHVPRAGDLDLPSWVAVRDYAAGGMEGVVMDLTFARPDELNFRLNSLHSYLATAMGSRSTSSVDLRQVSGGWQFSMSTTGLADMPAPAGADAGAFADLYRDVELVISVQLPGQIIDHNADQKNGQQLTWRLSAQSIQTQLYARSSTGRSFGTAARSNRTLQVATALATAGGLGVFAAVALHRRRDRAPVAAVPGPLRLGERPAASPPPPQAWPFEPPGAPPTESPPTHRGPPPG